MELWKEITNYEGIYEVSNLGNVRRIGKKKSLVILKDRYGYARVNLCKKGEKTKFAQVHRLVAQAFIPNQCDLPVVNHIDENKLNNKVENLQWCTTKQNCNYGTRNKRIKITKGHSIVGYNTQNGFLIKFFSKSEARRYGFSNVERLLSGKQKQCKGYFFVD